MGEQTEMQAVSLEQLLAKRQQTPSGFLEEWHEIEGVGYIQLRGLSRQEVLFFQKVGRNPAEIEQITLSHGMLQPHMTDANVKAWQKIALSGELDRVSRKLMEMSGMLPGAATKAYMEFEDNPASEFRSLPGGEAGHDGGDDAHRADTAPE